MAIEETKGGTVFTGDDVKNVFVVTSLAKGLRLYAKSGIKPNSNWTPKNMLAEAAKYTGKTYKRGEYEKAATDLEALAESNVKNRTKCHDCGVELTAGESRNDQQTDPPRCGICLCKLRERVKYE